jgi:pre-mRNA 3'-end-processing factor FIP1
VPTVAQEKVEIDKVAEYNGESLFNLDLESLEEKPWRKPGADVTDYFNYGFDEFTWTAYTSKQTNLRNEFNPAKVMSVFTWFCFFLIVR